MSHIKSCFYSKFNAFNHGTTTAVWKQMLLYIGNFCRQSLKQLIVRRFYPPPYYSPLCDILESFEYCTILFDKEFFLLDTVRFCWIVLVKDISCFYKYLFIER